MGLFYPTTFGIVGQKMTLLQHRYQGDPEDPHDEHYLLSTQSKQDQVKAWKKEKFCFWSMSCLFPHSTVFSKSLPSLLQTGGQVPDLLAWRVKWAVNVDLGRRQNFLGAVEEVWGAEE